MSNFSSIPEAIVDIQQGKLLIVLDEHREQEADFFLPAELITPQDITTMIRYGSGILLAALTQEQAYRLEIPFMVPVHRNTESTKLNITISVNAKQGITTGVSAFDRAKTISILAKPTTSPEELTRPGHVSCLVAKPNGLLERTGHTEAAVDLSRMAGFFPAGVLCEIVGEDGTMAQMPELKKLAKRLDIKIITLQDLITYRKKHPLPEFPQQKVIKSATASLPTAYGIFQISLYQSLETQEEYIVLTKGEITHQPLVRIHSECRTGDIFGSLRCDCGEQLHKTMQIIEKHGSGIIIYLPQEGRGIGLLNKIKAYALQDTGLDTVEANYALGFPADERDYSVAADTLMALGVTKVSLLTNNPDKIVQLEKRGIRVTKRISIETEPNKYNKKYLETKKEKLKHILKNV